MKKNSLMIIIMAICLVFVFVMTKKNTDTSNTCQVEPQAAFGQSRSPQWVEYNGPATAQAIAKFSLEHPDEINGYSDKKYYVFTGQIYEIHYMSGDEEMVRLAKGKMCGNDVYDITQDYRSKNTVTIDGIDVIEYGDGESVSIATWIDGEYSYFIGCWNSPLSTSEIEKLVKIVK